MTEYAVWVSKDRLEQVWVVQHGNEPLPHSRWFGDRYWPFVEVYSTWADAFRRVEALRDIGHAAMLESVRLAPAAEDGTR